MFHSEHKLNSIDGCKHGLLKFFLIFSMSQNNHTLSVYHDFLKISYQIYMVFVIILDSA